MRRLLLLVFPLLLCDSILVSAEEPFDAANSETGLWVLLGRAWSHVELPTDYGTDSSEGLLHNWQIGGGYQSQGWLDLGIQSEHFGNRIRGSSWSIRVFELRLRSTDTPGLPPFVAPILGLGYGWASKGPPNFPPRTIVDHGFTSKGPLATLGADLRLQPGRLVSVLVSGSYRWSALRTDWKRIDIEASRDVEIAGWSVSVQFRLYPRPPIKQRRSPAS